MRAVLWDADGVLQQTLPGAWDKAEEVVAEFPDALVGEPLDEDAVRAAVERLGLGGDAEEVLAVWSRFDVLPEPLAVVARVRAAGWPGYLTTNQDTLRASYMRARTAYDALLDGAYYSCDLGSKKPDAAYFHAVADDLGLPPGDLLLVDDSDDNVRGARAAGLQGIRWTHEEGTDLLLAALAEHGIEVG